MNTYTDFGRKYVNKFPRIYLSKLFITCLTGSLKNLKYYPEEIFQKKNKKEKKICSPWDARCEDISSIRRHLNFCGDIYFCEDI